MIYRAMLVENAFLTCRRVAVHIRDRDVGVYRQFNLRGSQRMLNGTGPNIR